MNLFQDVTGAQQEVSNALQEILSGKLAAGEMEAVVQLEGSEVTMDPAVTVFSCHLCSSQFSKRKALQQHIQTHQDFRPTVVSKKVVHSTHSHC